MALNKTESYAYDFWSEDTYRAIPKSVFAAVAWHLANEASGTADAPGAAEVRFVEEIKALQAAGIIPKDQAIRAARAVGNS